MSETETETKEKKALGSVSPEYVNPPTPGAAELVKARNGFYRDGYRKLLLALLVLIFALAGSVGLNIYQSQNVPEPKYFAATTDGRIMPLYALSNPMLSPQDLLQWAYAAVLEAYNYNFVNYRDSFQKLQNRFTVQGWRNFENALQASRNLETVIEKKLVVSAVATGTPVIIDRAVINGRFSWRVQIPLLVSYQSASDLTQTNVMVTVVVSRVPTVDYPKGVAIVSFIATDGGR